MIYMKRTLILAAVLFAACASSASAATLPLDVAKRAAVDAAERSLADYGGPIAKLTTCKRTSARRAVCVVRYRMNGPACFNGEPYVVQLSRDGERIKSVPSITSEAQYAYGDCAPVEIVER